MQIYLDFKSHEPIYLQIIEQIKHRLASGELQPGDQLPTVRQLATELRVNFNTIARAYRILDEEGVISTQHGRGTYILEPKLDDGGEQLKQQDLARLTRRFITEAEELGFSLEEITQVFKGYIEDLANERSSTRSRS
ncbi:MAG: GntR family transcriptional regulator [Chloroflexota bacterium]|nr:MAG: GntR family transcriptional regulator [Chloroflexota bacterium]